MTTNASPKTRQLGLIAAGAIGSAIAVACSAYAVSLGCDAFGRSAGYDGRLGVAERAPAALDRRLMKVSFDAKGGAGAPLPLARIGADATATAVFEIVRGPRDTLIARTGSGVVADRSAYSVSRIVCFCSSARDLRQPGAEPPMILLLRPRLGKGATPAGVRIVTLTLYPAPTPPVAATASPRKL